MSNETHNRKLADHLEHASEGQLADELTAARRLYDLHCRLADETDLDRALNEIVVAAAEITGTDRGCVQLISEDRRRLEIAAHHGYDSGSTFVSYFLKVGSEPVCDAARNRRQRIVIDNVETAPALQGTKDREIALAENIRATQSTPMITRAGEMVGVLSTQFRQPHQPADHELRLIDMLAWTAAEFVERHHANKALKAGEERYQTLFETINEGFCIIQMLFDDDGQPVDYRFLQTNPAFEAQTGLVNAQGRTMRELEPNHEAHWTEIYGRVAETGEPTHFVEEARHLDQRTFNVHAYRFGEPRERQVAILFEDISKRRQAEIATARLAAIVESSDDAIISKDLHGTMLTWNTAAQRLFGYTADEAVGQSVTTLMPRERVHEEEDILRRIGRGERIEHFETVRRRKDGSLLDASLTISPIIDDDGRIVGASKIARDISERRRAERLREQQTRMLELIASGAPLDECLTTLCRSVSRIKSGVRASLLVADATRATFRRQIAPDLQSPWGEGLTGSPVNDPMAGTCGEAMSRGQPVTCENVQTDERWSREWRQLCAANGVMATYSAPVQDQNNVAVASFMLCFGQPRSPTAWERALADSARHVASIALARDRSNEELREADRRKDEYLATLAHELRNPLAPLRTGLELMRRDDPKTTEKAHAMMARQLTQLTHLVDDLMDVSRITRGKIELRMAPTDLTTVVRDAVDSMRTRVAAAGHRLRLTLPAKPITLQADHERLTQVMTNLIDNAIQYTAADGQIEVVVEHTQDAAIVVVRDNGTGIATDRLIDIFDMFTQIKPPAGQTNNGLGIGLTLAKQVVELHGGTIEADSEGPGQGAGFTVRLPLTADEPAATAAHGTCATAARERRLLVVDDNFDVADAMALLLTSMGHEVRVAHDGLQALDETAAFTPDAVLLDLGMPGLDGLETARRMRARPEGQDLTLIALTGWGQQEDRRRTTEAGFDHHLVKPVEPDALERLLAEIDVK